jgi:hypothetical protein
LKRLSAVLLGCAAAIGCGDRGSGARFSVESLPGGGRRVSNHGIEEWSPQTRWTLEEDLAIGSVGGDGPDTFGFISALGVDAAGRIHVLDYIAQEVRVFDAYGRFEHRLGGKGRGPGEFVGADRLFVTPSGEVLVIDGRTARYSVFGRAGDLEVVRPRRVRGSAPFGGYLADGRFVDWGASFPQEGPDIVAGALTVFHPFRLSADLIPIDTLPPLSWEREMTEDGSRPQVFFAARMMGSQEASGRLWMSDSRRYEVIGRSLEGDTTLVFSLPADPAEVGEADRQAVRDRMASRPELADGYLSGLPATKPILRGVFGDGAGHVYVVPETADVSPGSAVDVFRDSGELLGRLELPVPMWTPPTGPVFEAHRDHLYYVVADDLDVPSIVRLTITRPS